MGGDQAKRFFGFYRLVDERLKGTNRPQKFAVQRAMERAASVDWWIHLVATSGRYNDSLWEIENRWSVRQLVAAHRVIDLWIELEKDENSRIIRSSGG